MNTRHSSPMPFEPNKGELVGLCKGIIIIAAVGILSLCLVFIVSALASIEKGIQLRSMQLSPNERNARSGGKGRKRKTESSRLETESGESWLGYAPPPAHGAPGDAFVTLSRLQKTISDLRRYTRDKVAELWRKFMRCENEPSAVKAPCTPGRRQNEANLFLFERAVLYQMSHSNCKTFNACKRSFLSLESGYTTFLSVYDYWRDHALEVEAIQKRMATQAAELGLTPKEYYDVHYNERKTKFRELRA